MQSRWISTLVKLYTLEDSSKLDGSAGISVPGLQDLQNELTHKPSVGNNLICLIISHSGGSLNPSFVLDPLDPFMVHGEKLHPNRRVSEIWDKGADRHEKSHGPEGRRWCEGFDKELVGSSR